MTQYPHYGSDAGTEDHGKAYRPHRMPRKVLTGIF